MNKLPAYIVVLICLIVSLMSILHIIEPYLFYGVVSFYKDIGIKVIEGITNMTFLELFAMSSVFFGVWYIAKPDIKGLWAMFFAQMAWAIHGFKSGQIALALQSIVLFTINVKGILNWKRQNIGSPKDASTDNKPNA